MFLSLILNIYSMFIIFSVSLDEVIDLSDCSLACFKAPSDGQFLKHTCVAGWHWRRESVAEEVDHLLEGSASVLPSWWRLSFQHNPRYVRAHVQPRGLEEHCVLWCFYISVVSPHISHYCCADSFSNNLHICMNCSKSWCYVEICLFSSHSFVFCRYKGASGSSAVCSFTMDQVEAAFNGRYREVNRETQQWYTYNHPVPEPRPGAVSVHLLPSAG